MEAYRLEYDCSVKYEEHGASKEEEASQQTSRLTTNFSKIILDSINSEVIIMYKVVLRVNSNIITFTYQKHAWNDPVS